MSTKVVDGITFRDIPGYLGYFISRDGSVYSDKTGCYLTVSKPYKTKPYPTVQLTQCGKCSSVPVHRLLALAWLPVPKGYTVSQLQYAYKSRALVVDHIDGNKTNYKLENLRWLTNYDNLNSNNFTGTKGAPKGNKSAVGHKYNPSSKVHYVYIYNKKEYSLKDLCAELGKSRSCIIEEFRKTLGLVKQGKLTRRIK